MSETIRATLEGLCLCQLSASNLFNKTLTCEPSDGNLTFTMSTVYASANGSLLASELTTDAQQWIVGERNISGSAFLISVPEREVIRDTPTSITMATEVRIITTAKSEGYNLPGPNTSL